MIGLEADGLAYGYINTNGGSTLTYHSQTKFSAGKNRGNLRLADVNGDGWYSTSLFFKAEQGLDTTER